MLQLFSYALLIRCFASAGALIVFILSVFGEEASAWQILVWIIRAGAIAYVAIELLNWAGWWRIIWKRSGFLEKMYPDLQGTWRGSVKSNFRAWETKQINEEYTKPITLRIYTDLFRIRMYLETDDRYSTSETLLVHPVRREAGSPARLRYMYKNSTIDPKPGDEQSHLGASEVSVSTKSGLALSGPYWTNRKWGEGLNTAGTIEVKQISPDPDADPDADVTPA